MPFKRGSYAWGPKIWEGPCSLLCLRDGGKPQESQLCGLSRSLAKSSLSQQNSEKAELLQTEGPRWARVKERGAVLPSFVSGHSALCKPLTLLRGMLEGRRGEDPGSDWCGVSNQPGKTGTYGSKSGSWKWYSLHT